MRSAMKFSTRASIAEATENGRRKKAKAELVEAFNAMRSLWITSGTEYLAEQSIDGIDLEALWDEIASK